MLKKFLRDNSVHKKIVSIQFFDYLFLYKPIYLLGPITMVLVGMYLANFSSAEHALGITTLVLNTSLFILGVSIIMSCVFIQNEIMSIDRDSNTRFNFIEKNIIGNKIDIKVARLIHNYSLGLGFLLILLTSWINIFFVATVYFLWIYSANNSTDMMKKLFFNVIISFFLILSGWLYADNSFNHPIQFILFLFLSAPYICLFLSTIILIDFPKGQLSVSIPIILITAGLLISFYNNDPLGTTSLSVSFPFYLFLVFRGMERDSIRAIRYPMFLLVFFIFSIYPLLMIPIIIIYYLSKYYYWHRFDIHFPALAINDDYN